MKKLNPILPLKILAIISGIIPLLWLVYLILVNKLGADPAKDVQHFTGTTTINFLLATLLISPIVQISHWNILNRLKRTIGLTSFFWALAHILSYLIFELAGDLNLFFSELTSRTYLNIGALAWFGLFILAITSNQFSMKKLKKNWKRVHNIVYPIAVLAAIHYYIALKVKDPIAIYYLIVFIVLWINHIFRLYKRKISYSR